MSTQLCSANHCDKVGTRFDGAYIELFACKEHETKWRNQMIDLGVSCLNNYATFNMNPLCGVQTCPHRGYYYVNGVSYFYCISHSDVGAMCSYQL